MDFDGDAEPIFVYCSTCGERIKVTQIVEHCKECAKNKQTAKGSGEEQSVTEDKQSNYEEFCNTTDNTNVNTETSITNINRNIKDDSYLADVRSDCVQEVNFNLKGCESNRSCDIKSFSSQNSLDIEGHTNNTYAPHADNIKRTKRDNSCVIVNVCPYCRVPQIPDSKFCGACGARRDGYDEKYLVDSSGVHLLT